MTRGISRWSLVLAAVIACGVTGMAEAARPLFILDDARGDDRGDGSLVYPETEDLEPGDLDLVSLSAYAVSGGTEFKAVFGRTIKQPTRRPIDGNVMLDDVAKLGFFTFNLDLYIDIDRESGSGRVATLPGRLAEIHPDHAWEKVVCLTPRPDTSRSRLRQLMVAEAKRELKSEQGSVRRADVADIRDEVAVDVADDVFFPERVRVRGRTVRFFVPATFLGGTADASWSYVVAVSGCDLQTTLQTKSVDAGMVELPFSGLMILPVKAGGSRYTFGSDEPDVEMLPPLVDIMVPEGASQEDVLRSFDVLAGRKASLLGVVPGG